MTCILMEKISVSALWLMQLVRVYHKLADMAGVARTTAFHLLRRRTNHRAPTCLTAATFCLLLTGQALYYTLLRKDINRHQRCQGVRHPSCAHCICTLTNPSIEAQSCDCSKTQTDDEDCTRTTSTTTSLVETNSSLHGPVVVATKRPHGHDNDIVHTVVFRCFRTAHTNQGVRNIASG